MSLANLTVIMGRIKTATEASPIAVFKSAEYGKLNAVFGATVLTQSMINIGDPDYLGLYHKDMDLKKIKSVLMVHA
jgi:hypothetical protein